MSHYLRAATVRYVTIWFLRVLCNFQRESVETGSSAGRLERAGRNVKTSPLMGAERSTVAVSPFVKESSGGVEECRAATAGKVVPRGSWCQPSEESSGLNERCRLLAASRWWREKTGPWWSVRPRWIIAERRLPPVAYRISVAAVWGHKTIQRHRNSDKLWSWTIWWVS